MNFPICLRESQAVPGQTLHNHLSKDKIYMLSEMFVLLGELSRDGFFLVRESQTTPGDYGLSVVYGEEVIHYQIRRHGEDAFFSIGKFIENYNFHCTTFGIYSVM